MRYLIIILVLFLSCNKPQRCEVLIIGANGSALVECCADGLFRESTICKCIKDYNKVHGSNYKCK